MQNGANRAPAYRRLTWKTQDDDDKDAINVVDEPKTVAIIQGAVDGKSPTELGRRRADARQQHQVQRKQRSE